MAIYPCSCGPSESLEPISVESQSSYPQGSTWYFKHSEVARHRGNSSSHRHLAARNIIWDADCDVETANNTSCSAGTAGVKMVTVIYLRGFESWPGPLPELNLILYHLFINMEGGWRSEEFCAEDSVSKKWTLSTFSVIDEEQRE